MKVSTIKDARERKLRNVSVSDVLSKAEDMQYDSIFICGVKDGQLSAGWSTDSAFELLGAVDMAKDMYKEAID